MKRDLQGNEVSKFTDVGPRQSAVMTNDVTMASNILSIAAETVTFSAGAAGTTGIVSLDKAPVFDAYGSKIGSKGATSFAWVTGTLLTLEVDYDYSKTDAEMLASLSNGEYAIDYVLGRIYYRKATTDVSDTCNYKTRQLNIEITASAAPSLGSVKIEDGTTAATKALVSDANTARAATDHVIAVQNIDANGKVLSVGSAAMAASAPVTVATDDTQFGAVGAAADVDGNIHGQLRYAGEAIDDIKASVFAEDSAHTTGDKGVQMLVVRQDVAGALGDTDGDYVPLQVDATGALRITGSVSAATEYAEDSAHNSGDKGIQMLGVQKAVNAALADDGDYAPIQVSQDGYVKTTMNAIRDAAVAIGSGAMDGGTQRVNMATDSPDVTALEKIDDWEDSGAFENYAKATIYGENGAGAPVKMLMDAAGNPQVDVVTLPVGAGLMAASTPVTIATDDTHMGAVGAAADPDGVIHAQLRSIAEYVDALPTALGVALSAASLPVVVASDDAHFGAVGAGGDSAGAIHEQLRYMCDGIDGITKTIYKAVATGAAAISLTSAAAAVWELDSVTVHFDAAPTTSENLQISLDSTDGAAYDTVLLKVDPSAAALTDITFIPSKPLTLASGDEIVVSFANTDTKTYGVRIVGNKIG